MLDFFLKRCSPDDIYRSSPSSDPWAIHGDGEPFEYHVRINGMFTLPEARGQGIAKALVEEVLKYGTNEAMKLGRTYAASIVVDMDNPAARALYEKCGFLPVKQETFYNGSPREVLLMKCEAVVEGSNIKS